jgi:hypothetical protein
MWLLLLALPVQGFAAATMMHCGAHHLQVHAQSLAAATGAAHHAHDAHDGATPQVARAQVDVESDSASMQQLDRLTKFKGSACAACCMGVVLPPAMLVVADVPAATSMTLFVPALHPDFVSPGLERPPRSLHL